MQATKLDGDLQEVKMQFAFLKQGQNKIKRGLGILTAVFILNLMFGGREGTIFIDKLAPVAVSLFDKMDIPNVFS